MAAKDLRPALRAFLLADPTIAGLVGNDRVRPVLIQQGDTGPTIVYTKITEQTPVALDGGISWLVSARYQIDALASSAYQAQQLADAVKERMNGAQGVWGSGAQAVTVQGAFVANGFEGFDAATKLHNSSRDYFIHFEDSAAP